MAVNYTVIQLKCFENGMFDPEIVPPPPGLIIGAIVHIYLVVVLGTLCKFNLLVFLTFIFIHFSISTFPSVKLLEPCMLRNFP